MTFAAFTTDGRRLKAKNINMYENFFTYVLL